MLKDKVRCLPGGLYLLPSNPGVFQYLAKYHKNMPALVINCKNLADYHKKRSVVVIVCVISVFGENLNE